MTTELVVTINDDFTDALSDVPAILATTPAFAVFVQEGKRSRYRSILRRLRRQDARPAVERPERYRQVQITKDDARAGLAIVWDELKAPLASGPHYRVLVAPTGAAMLPRGILWVAVHHVELGHMILATTHRPPWRYRRLWAAYDRALGAWAERQPARLLVGLDANTTRLWELARRLGLSVAGVGIDGVLARGFRLRNPRRLKRRTSDHRPVAVDVHDQENLT